MNDKKSKDLTENEKIRWEKFNQTKADFESKGYKCIEKTMGTLYVNIMAVVVMLPYFILTVVLYEWRHDFNWFSFFGVAEDLQDLLLYFAKLILFMLIIFVFLFVHEGIHGICFAKFAKKGKKAVSFGFNKAAFAPYCTTDEPLTRRQYIAAAIMPTVFLGFIPSLIAIYNGSVFALIIGVIMTFGGGGDFLMIYKLLAFKSESKDLFFMDSPTEIGSYIFVKEEDAQ